MTNLEYTLLAWTALHPGMSGYEIHKIIEESSRYVIKASYSQIYPGLKKLNDAGFVSICEEPIANRRAKKRYTITETGRRELNQWLSTPVDVIMDFPTFRLRVALSPLMDKEDLLSFIDQSIQQVENVIVDEHDPHDDAVYAYIDTHAVAPAKIDAAWVPLWNQFKAETELKLEWLRDWRATVEKEFE